MYTEKLMYTQKAIFVFYIIVRSSDKNERFPQNITRKLSLLFSNFSTPTTFDIGNYIFQCFL